MNLPNYGTVVSSLLAVVAFSFVANNAGAQVSANCGDPCTASIGFTYSANVTAESASVGGTGSFTVPVGFGNPNTSPGLADVSSFQFTLNASVPDLGNSAFNYNQGTLTNFALNFSGAAPTPSNVLSFQTTSVAPTNPIFCGVN